MFKKLMFLVSFVVLLGMAGVTSAVNLIELRRLAERTCAVGSVRIWLLLLGQQTQDVGGFFCKIFLLL